MFLEVIRSEGLAHLSYIVGHGRQAAVIDPRRDCEVYIDIAHRNGARITHIFETHRNEDYVIGSNELARRTGAAIYHGSALEFTYGNAVSDGERFDLDGLYLTILETPGHTYESISITVHDPAFGEEAVGVFTGDALFIGDVGRTDFFPGKEEETAGLLYESIFNKLLPLGGHVLLYPAHGAGSVCGSGMASREFSTLGYERLNNPVLQHTTRDAFVQHKVREKHYRAPYFRTMEEYNLKGNAPEMPRLPRPRPMSTEEFAAAMEDTMVAVDVRSPEALAGAFIPGSLALPMATLAGYGGWFLEYDHPIGIITEPGAYDHIEAAVRELIRMGFDDIVGFLEGGLHVWETSARTFACIPSVHVSQIRERIKQNEEFTILDVRQEEEFAKGHLKGATNIYLGHVLERLEEIPRDRPVVTFCGSGQRAIVAASLLKKHGYLEVENCLGSMAACRNTKCPIEAAVEDTGKKD